MDVRYAPWSDEVVDILRDRQIEAKLHPYTCAFHGSASLVPTHDGWVCPVPICDFKQNWAFTDDTQGRWWTHG